MFFARSSALSTAALVAASYITLTSAAPHPSTPSGMTLKKRGDEASDADKPKPPANPEQLPANSLGVTGLWHLTWNTSPLTSTDSVINFDPATYGGKAESGWGGYCNKSGDIGCLGGDDGAGHMYSVMYKCTEIDSKDSGKKALVWKRYRKCGAVAIQGTDGYGRDAGQTKYEICWKDGNGATCR